MCIQYVCLYCIFVCVYNVFVYCGGPTEMAPPAPWTAPPPSSAALQVSPPTPLLVGEGCSCTSYRHWRRCLQKQSHGSSKGEQRTSEEGEAESGQTEMVTSCVFLGVHYRSRSSLQRSSFLRQRELPRPMHNRRWPEFSILFICCSLNAPPCKPNSPCPTPLIWLCCLSLSGIVTMYVCDLSYVCLFILWEGVCILYTVYVCVYLMCVCVCIQHVCILWVSICL